MPVASGLATVVKNVVNHRQSPTTIETYEDTSEEHSEASKRSKYVAGPTRNRNERPCCSHGPAVLKTTPDDTLSTLPAKEIGQTPDDTVVKFVGTHGAPSSSTVPEALAPIMKLDRSPEARHLAELICEGPGKRCALFLLAVGRLPEAQDLDWIRAESPERLRAILALQADEGLQLGILKAALEFWPQETPKGHVTEPGSLSRAACGQ